tara:strand:- start:7 stop:627 length:621 start_codon:yes stop_codon:yes gene_type:complete
MSIVKLNNQAVKNATAFGSITGLGSMVFIKKLTASGSATLSFVDGASSVVLDNTYKEYLFTFKDIHPATNNQDIQFNASVDGGSNYNVTKTSTTFQAQHDEADSEALLQYNTDRDLAQSTSAQRFSLQIGNGNDECVAGYLHIFNPSSTTFVKHYIARVNGYNGSNYSQDFYTAGYMNTTSAVDAIQFSFQSGNIDAGDICLYGIA